MINDCRVESLISENNKLRIALIEEQRVGMRPCALARELKYLSVEERKEYLNEIKSIINSFENMKEGKL